MDTSATYTRAARLALPHATVIVDRFHLVAIANRGGHRVPAGTGLVASRPAGPASGARVGAAEPVAPRRRVPDRAGVGKAARRDARRGPLRWSREMLAGKGNAPPTARPGRHRPGPEPDLAAADRLLHALRRLRDPPAPPARLDRQHLAGVDHPGHPHRHQQRPHRGLQPHRQARRTDRVWLPQHREPETPYTIRLHPSITPGANQNPQALLTLKTRY